MGRYIYIVYGNLTNTRPPPPPPYSRSTRTQIPVCLGIFGVFFFLGIEGTGSVVFNEVLVNGAKEFFAGNVALSR